MVDAATIADVLAAQEAAVMPAVRKGCEKRIVWAGDAGVKTATSVVFIHGFSATGEEVRPLPDLVADGLGANLFFTRLNGHGQDAEAMGQASLDAWMHDTLEALNIAEAIGDKVIVIGCSTGCTLATLAFAQGRTARAMVHISPNFGLRHRVLQGFLDLPAARHWAKYVAGKTRSFPPHSAAHDAYWTLTYPTAAVHVMADTVRAARHADGAKITTPALFCYNDADQVVHAKDTRAMMQRWGAKADEIRLIQTAQDDAMGHIMAGDIMSPNQTAPLAARILAWLDTLLAC